MKPKLLVVDDSQTARAVVIEALQDYECEVLEAGDGAEALRLASREMPQVILLDVTMPVMDGIQMLEQLKADRRLKDLPVVMLTGQNSREAVVKIARLGVRDYLVKPFTLEALLARVSQIVDLRPKGEPEAATKRMEDPLVLLLVDDKPAIHDLVRMGLGETGWQVQCCSTIAEALEFCGQTPPDGILASLTLPDGAVYSLLQSLRSGPKTRRVPVLALSVKNALAEHTRALQAGFCDVVTKPLRFDELKVRIAKALRLDMSGKYFEARDGVLVLRLPFDAPFNSAEDVFAQLRDKTVAAVDAGLDKVVIDLEYAKADDKNCMKLTLTSVRFCEELGLDYRITGPEGVCAECKRQQEAKFWKFTASVDEAASEMAGTSGIAA